MKVLLYDFRWLDEHNCEFQASADNRFGRKKIKIGDRLSLEVKSREKKCAGSIENGAWKPCPKNSVGKAKCDYCRAIEGNFVYTAFDGFNQSELGAGDLDKISDTHMVYLAFFAENLIKVGVSKNSRKNLRQIEQGSLATLFIAETPDGIAARQIETILRQAGLADKIQIAQKKKVFLPDLSAAEIREFMNKKFAHYLASLDEHEHLRKFILTQPEFVSWENVYNFAKIKHGTKPFHHLDLHEGEWVSGTIISIRGPFVTIETDAEKIAICAKKLCGLEVDFEPKEVGLRTNAVMQGSLF